MNKKLMPQHRAFWRDNHSESNDFTEGNSEGLNTVTNFFCRRLEPSRSDTRE